ncbi:MAG: sulfotransferase [candidate division WOR-3 bacterium]
MQTILYITGSGRSGSTILDILLGEGDNTFSIGEFKQFWKKFLKKGALCSCNKNYLNCNFWSEIIKEIFGKYEISEKEIDYFCSLQKIVERIPLINFFQTKKYILNYKKEIEEYKNFLLEIYGKIFKNTGASIIIDSSKLPHYLFLLKDIPYEIKIIHLIRDPRGVAYSWTKLKFDPSVNEYMKRYHPFTSVRKWIYINFVIEILKKDFKYFTRLKYEDFCCSPQTNLNKVLKELNLLIHGLPNLSNKKFIIKKLKHLVGGNPNRFNDKEIFIHLDYQWVKEFSTKNKILVSLLCLPMLLKYKYSILNR